MAHLLIWSQRAVDDLENIAAYIAQDSESYAASVVREILQKARALAEFPKLGRTVPEFADESIREIFSYSYRVIYRIDETTVEIAAVVHGRRSLEIALDP